MIYAFLEKHTAIFDFSSSIGSSHNLTKLRKQVKKTIDTAAAARPPIPPSTNSSRTIAAS